MNTHGRHALEIVKTRDPLGYAQIADPESHFSNLGQEIQVRIWVLSEELLPAPGDRSPIEYDELVSIAQLRARELVYQELIYEGLPPEAETPSPTQGPGRARRSKPRNQ